MTKDEGSIIHNIHLLTIIFLQCVVQFLILFFCNLIICNYVASVIAGSNQLSSMNKAVVLALVPLPNQQDYCWHLSGWELAARKQ